MGTTTGDTGAAPVSGTHMRSAPGAVGEAHGKAILIGEHAAVYGAPAIILPLHDLRVRAEFDASDAAPELRSDLFDGPLAAAPTALGPLVRAWEVAAAHVGAAPAGVLHITSDVPVGRGLGSSAAVAAAVVEAVAARHGATLSAAERHELIQAAERVAHTTPSGIDAASVVAAAPLRFERGSMAAVAAAAPFTFVLADTGRPGSTAKTVAAVRARHEAGEVAVSAAVDGIAALVHTAQQALAAGDTALLGRTMDSAHTHLSALGVSTPELDTLVAAARTGGALGAKLTGGGGGGCIIALSPNRSSEALERALIAAGATRTWTATLETTA